MFYTMAFPIILATLFWMVLSKASSVEAFSHIPIAVVKNNDSATSDIFMEVLKVVSEEGDYKLFDITYTDGKAAEDLLLERTVYGIITVDEDNGIVLTINQNGINQTIIKMFLDDYEQSLSTVRTISSDPYADKANLYKDIFNKKDYLTKLPVNDSIIYPYINSFYTLIAMMCLYGGILGTREIINISADMSSSGARVSVAPTHKLKTFFTSMTAAFLVQLTQLFILMLYLIFVLKVDFGDNLGIIALTCVSGTFTGAALGGFVGVMFKGSEAKKTGLIIAVTMLMCFLSGMMIVEVKYAINNSMPILNKISPGALITDCFYSLHFYNNYDIIYQNIAILWGFTAVFGTFIYLRARRQKYESI